eukprot:COSAG05_NODE_414_length_10051_cov_120.012158_7_plen_69_part_00
MGEPGRWPHVSSSFGAIDLAGFLKPPAYFYRAKVCTHDAVIIIHVTALYSSCRSTPRYESLLRDLCVI